MSMYLTEEEIEKYCDMMPVTESQVIFASGIIDAYVGTVNGKSKFSIFTSSEILQVRRKGALKLRNAPVISIEHVFLRGNNYFTTPSEYELTVDYLQWDSDGYIYMDINGNRSINTNYWYMPTAKEVRIEYTYGYSEVPERVKLACAMLAMNISQTASFTSLDSITTLDSRFALANPSLFTPDIKALLSEYR